MSTMTHTPGPWLYRAKSNSIHAAPEAGTGHSFGRRIIQFAEGDDGECIESDADRALVIAAPKMLAALKVLAANSSIQVNYPTECELIDDVIAEAEVQS